MTEPSTSGSSESEAAVASSIRVERIGKVAVIHLNRPKALNALNDQVSRDILQALTAFDADQGVHVTVITGSEKAFAAGADIAEMHSKSFSEMYRSNYFGKWDEMTSIRKPIIAAVGGYALGGGCELAMLCDIVIASTTAKFGQPEIKLGIIPGIGGTQRLPRLVGRTLAMDLILSGRMIDAEEAKSAGLVSRVVSPEQLLPTCIELAETIASYSLSAVMMAKEAVNRSQETSLSEGVRTERRLFQAAFATADQKEGMAAFLEKRKPSFSGS